MKTAWTKNGDYYNATIGKYVFRIYRYESRWCADAKPIGDEKYYTAWCDRKTLKACKEYCEWFAE